MQQISTRKSKNAKMTGEYCTYCIIYCKNPHCASRQRNRFCNMGLCGGKQRPGNYNFLDIICPKITGLKKTPKFARGFEQYLG
jgi:hypothetical protein